MNTCCLTELVLLSIGGDKGVLDATLFTALVLMAIITTVMTSPLLKRIYPDRMVEHDIAEAERASLGDAIAFRVLVAIDDPTRAEPLVDLACGIARAQLPAEVVLTKFEEQPDDAAEGELSAFLDTIASASSTPCVGWRPGRDRGLSVQSFSQRTTSLAPDIAAQAQRVGARLVLVGDRRDDPAWVRRRWPTWWRSGRPTSVWSSPRCPAPVRSRRPGRRWSRSATARPASPPWSTGSAWPSRARRGPPSSACPPARRPGASPAVVARLDRMGRPGRTDAAAWTPPTVPPSSTVPSPWCGPSPAPRASSPSSGPGPTPSGSGARSSSSPPTRTSSSAPVSRPSSTRSRSPPPPAEPSA